MTQMIVKPFGQRSDKNLQEVTPADHVTKDDLLYMVQGAQDKSVTVGQIVELAVEGESNLPLKVEALQRWADGIDDDMIVVKQDIQDNKAGLSALDSRVTAATDLATQANDKADQNAADITAVSETVQALEPRIELLADAVNVVEQEITQLIERTDNIANELDVQVVRLDEGIAAVQGDVAGLDERVTIIEDAVPVIEANIGTLTQDVAGLDVRVTDTEAFGPRIQQVESGVSNAPKYARNVGNGAISVTTRDNIPIGGNGAPIPFNADGYLTESHNGMILICGSDRVAYVDAGMSVGFGLAARGPITFTPVDGTVAVSDLRDEGFADAWCALVQTGANTYDVIGRKL